MESFGSRSSLRTVTMLANISSALCEPTPANMLEPEWMVA
jgi:hypothetical protein